MSDKLKTLSNVDGKLKNDFEPASPASSTLADKPQPNYESAQPIAEETPESEKIYVPGISFWSV